MPPVLFQLFWGAFYAFITELIKFKELLEKRELSNGQVHATKILGLSRVRDNKVHAQRWFSVFDKC